MNDIFGNVIAIIAIPFERVLFALVGYFYLETDGNLLGSSAFLISVLAIASSFSIYWMITVYMEFRNLKS